MRPRTLDEFVGQPHLVGDDGALTRVVSPGHRPSLILWGPPGSGKTTLARLLADRAGGTWRQLSAVTSGVADIRALVAEAKALREAGGHTIGFIDELHRFNKSQQDALLPHVEDGTITLIGATTENPYFEVNSALLSRLRVFVLKPLAEDDLRLLSQRALADAETDVQKAEQRSRREVEETRRQEQRTGEMEARFAAARGEMILLNDVRQPLTPVSARTLAAALADPEVGCAAGTLVVAGSDYSSVPYGWVCTLLGFVAVVCSATNAFGGFLITDRMLRMFRTTAEREKGGGGSGAGTVRGAR